MIQSTIFASSITLKIRRDNSSKLKKNEAGCQPASIDQLRLND
jgi:hypothetical protein